MTSLSNHDVYTVQDDRAHCLLGLRPSDARPCPRVVARKRCRAAGAGRCECETHATFMDHTRMWLDREGRHVLTTEPYNRDGLAVATFLESMDAIGLDTTVTGASPWNPGWTFCIVVRKPA